MEKRSTITRADYENYLVYLYFGAPSESGYLRNCIVRAYRDFNRTLRGLRIVTTKNELYQQAQQLVHQQIELLCQPQTRPIDQTAFDTWHRGCCEQLVILYHNHNHQMYIGQAQKWINMSLKYVFALGEERLPGYQSIYPYCHAPLDAILIRRLQPCHPPPLPPHWSRIDDYDQYLGYQQWIRESSTELPLDREFRLWLQLAPSSAADADSRCL